MKALRILGWILVPYVMIFVSWNQLTTAKKTFGIAWAALALIVAIGSLSSEQSSVQTTSEITSETVDSASDKTSEPAQSSTEQSSTSASQPKVEPSAEPDNDPGISKEEFDQIKTGMTYEEVVSIIGGPGEILSESGTPGGSGLDLHTVIYMWDGEWGFGANANIMFQDNKLQTKAQFGL